MNSFFEYEKDDMKAEIGMRKEGKSFVFSTVTFRNGQVYHSKLVSSENFDLARNSFYDALQVLIDSGFTPIERI